MKKIVFVLSLCFIAFSCNTMGKSEKAILDYMRDQTGAPELEIEFANVQVTKQTVGDSINILQQAYEQSVKEREERIKRLEEESNKGLEQMKSLSKSDMMYQFLVQSTIMGEEELKRWTNKVITNEKIRYDGQDTGKIIATVVHCQMTSLINPKLKAKQTKEGSFLLTPDESRCIRQLK